MSAVVPPSTLSFAGHSSEDDVDGLLRAFYKAEMPNPWPPLEAPAARNVVLPFRPAAKRFPMLRTRLALAACVAFLVAGPLALSAYFTGSNTDTAATTVPTPIDEGRANNPPKPGDINTPDFHLLQKDGRTWTELKVFPDPGKK
jgi:hypothetical protein